MSSDSDADEMEPAPAAVSKRQRLNGYNDLMDQMLAEFANALRANGGWSGAPTGNRLDDIRENMLNKKAGATPGRAALEARRALGMDDQAYLNAGVLPLWTSVEADAGVIVPDAGQLHLLGGRMQSQVEERLRQAAEASKADANEALKAAGEQIGWLLDLDEVRDELLDVAVQRGLPKEGDGGADDLKTLYAAKPDDGFKKVQELVRKGLVRPFLEALLVFLDPDAQPQRILRELEAHGIEKIVFHAAVDQLRLHKAFALRDIGTGGGTGDSAGTLLGGTSGSTVCDTVPVDPSIADIDGVLKYSFAQIVGDGQVEAGWDPSPVRSPFWESLNRDEKKGKLPSIPDAGAAGTRRTELNAALDARAHSNAVATALSKPSLFDSELAQTQPALAAAVPMHMYVRFALLRGVCGARGPAEAPLSGDVLMYTYPTMPLRNGVQMDRVRRRVHTPSAADEKSLERMSMAVAEFSRRRYGAFLVGTWGEGVVNLCDAGLKGAEAETVKVRLSGNRGGDLQEPPRQVGWAPMTLQTEEMVPALEDPSAQHASRAAVLEHIIATLKERRDAGGDLARRSGMDDSEDRSLTAAIVAAKLNQLESLAHVAKAATPPAASFASARPPPVATTYRAAAGGTEVFVTRPPVMCANKMLFPADAGLARFARRAPAAAAEPIDVDLSVVSTSSEVLQVALASASVDFHTFDARAAATADDASALAPPQLGNQKWARPPKSVGDAPVHPDLYIYSAKDAHVPWKERLVRNFGILGGDFQPSQLNTAALRKLFEGATCALRDLDVANGHVELADRLSKRSGVAGADLPPALVVEPDEVARSVRSGLWKSALREIAVSQDPLYAFVRSLSGTLGESAESVVEIDADLLRAQKQLGERRKAASERTLSFQTRLIETMLTSALRESKLRLDLKQGGVDSAGQQLAQQLVISRSDAKEALRDLASGQSGRPFFDAQVELSRQLDRGGTDPVPVLDVIRQINELAKSYQQNAAGKLVEDVTDSMRLDLEGISEPKNLFCIRLKDETYAAVRKAFVTVGREVEAHGHRMRHVRLIEYIEGGHLDLTTAFSDYVALTLQQLRMTSTSLAAYAGLHQVKMNHLQAGVALGRLVQAHCRYVLMHNGLRPLPPAVSAPRITGGGKTLLLGAPGDGPPPGGGGGPDDDDGGGDDVRDRVFPADGKSDDPSGGDATPPPGAEKLAPEEAAARIIKEVKRLRALKARARAQSSVRERKAAYKKRALPMAALRTKVAGDGADQAKRTARLVLKQKTIPEANKRAFIEFTFGTKRMEFDLPVMPVSGISQDTWIVAGGVMQQARRALAFDACGHVSDPILRAICEVVQQALPVEVSQAGLPTTFVPLPREEDINGRKFYVFAPGNFREQVRERTGEFPPDPIVSQALNTWFGLPDVETLRDLPFAEIAGQMEFVSSAFGEVDWVYQEGKQRYVRAVNPVLDDKWRNGIEQVDRAMAVWEGPPDAPAPPETSGEKNATQATRAVFHALQLVRLAVTMLAIAGAPTASDLRVNNRALQEEIIAAERSLDADRGVLSDMQEQLAIAQQEKMLCDDADSGKLGQCDFFDASRSETLETAIAALKARVEARESGKKALVEQAARLAPRDESWSVQSVRTWLSDSFATLATVWSDASETPESTADEVMFEIAAEAAAELGKGGGEIALKASNGSLVPIKPPASTKGVSERVTWAWLARLAAPLVLPPPAAPRAQQLALPAPPTAPPTSPANNSISVYTNVSLAGAMADAAKEDPEVNKQLVLASQRGVSSGAVPFPFFFDLGNQLRQTVMSDANPDPACARAVSEVRVKPQAGPSYRRTGRM
tara:strand:- start:163 stop:5634 length:5472 start_codon:yes stop_codon:yes gene_type:complete